jgi:hypothetical protein
MRPSSFPQRTGRVRFEPLDALDLHTRLATALVLYLAALGIWGILLGIAARGPTPSFRGALVIAEVAIAGQGLLGILAWPSSGPPGWQHILYGAALLLAIPLAATFVRQGSPRRTALTLGLASLFAMGLAIRGMTTA